MSITDRDVWHWIGGEFRPADPVTGDVRWRWDCETGTWGEPIPPTGDYWWDWDCGETTEPTPGSGGIAVSGLVNHLDGSPIDNLNQGDVSNTSAQLSVYLSTDGLFSPGVMWANPPNLFPAANLPAGTATIDVSINVPGVLPSPITTPTTWVLYDNSAAMPLIRASTVDPLLFTFTGKDSDGATLWIDTVSFDRIP